MENVPKAVRTEADKFQNISMISFVQESLGTSAEIDTKEPHSIHITKFVPQPPGNNADVKISDNDKAQTRILCPWRVRKMYGAAFCCLLMSVSMGFATGYSAPATFSMQASDLETSKESISWVGSILAIGAMIGGLIGGVLADKCGRRGSLLLNAFLFISAWMVIAFSSSIVVIIVGRFICGVSCGIISVAVPMYCVEISTPEVRGLLGTLFQTFIVTGSLCVSLIGYFVSWEYLALSGAWMVFLALACFVSMPESPKFWLAKGMKDKAYKVILALQGDYLDANEECNRIDNELKSQPKGRLTFEECSNPIVYKPALLTVGLMFFQQFTGSNAVLYYATELFSASKNFLDPKIATIILGAIQVVATIFSNLLVDRLGRRVLLCLSGVIMFISLIGLGIYYESVTRGVDLNAPWIPLVSICIFIIAFSIGYGPIPWLLAAEMVPLRARSAIGGLATFANGLFAFIITKTFAQLLNVIKNYGVFFTYGAISCASCVFVLVFIPETKGIDNEEISKYFRKNPKESAETLEEIRTVSVISVNNDILINEKHISEQLYDTSPQSKSNIETYNEQPLNEDGQQVLNNELHI